MPRWVEVVLRWLTALVVLGCMLWLAALSGAKQLGDVSPLEAYVTGLVMGVPIAGLAWLVDRLVFGTSRRGGER